MGMARAALLWASRNEGLCRRLPRYRFVRAAVRRFMPGEAVEDAVGAAGSFARRGLPTTVTELGENVLSPLDAEEVTQRYLRVIDRVSELGLDTELSVKPSHLGFDLDRPLAESNLARLAARAEERSNWIWVDMEASSYVEGTLAIYRNLRGRFRNVGVCLQAYLRRTRGDVDELVRSDAGIRLVKGAYRESKDLLVGGKRDVDEAFFDLALRALPAAKAGSLRLAVATHDLGLIERIERWGTETGVDRSAYEIQMLYGIRQPDQFRLLEAGYRVRTLIAYGTHWYPWYMRRLAERPANVFFVVRNLFQRAPA